MKAADHEVVHLICVIFFNDSLASIAKAVDDLWSGIVQKPADHTLTTPTDMSRNVKNPHVDVFFCAE
jgi:hypothetical protein